MKIIVIGTTFVDIKGYPLGTFIPNGRNAGTVETFHGGVGRNIAEDVAGLGYEPVFVGLVDESGTGIDVIERLKARGVETKYMRKTPDGMGTWLAIFDESGDVYANISKRNNLLPVADIMKEQGDEIFADADSILLEIDMDEEVIATTFAFAEKYRIPVYTVISNMEKTMERWDYVKRTDCFFCNAQEAGQRVGYPTEDYSPEEMISLVSRHIKELGLSRWIVTMDSRGSIYVDADGNSCFCPTEKVEVVDTTGAGDAFFAGAASALTAKMTPQQALVAGTNASAKVICSLENTI